MGTRNIFFQYFFPCRLKYIDTDLQWIHIICEDESAREHILKLHLHPQVLNLNFILCKFALRDFEDEFLVIQFVTQACKG